MSPDEEHGSQGEAEVFHVDKFHGDDQRKADYDGRGVDEMCGPEGIDQYEADDGHDIRLVRGRICKYDNQNAAEHVPKDAVGEFALAPGQCWHPVSHASGGG